MAVLPKNDLISPQPAALLKLLARQWQQFAKAAGLFRQPERATLPRVAVALSGGRDSVFLLAQLCGLWHDMGRNHPGFQLSAVHVHHNLQPQADAWGEFCARLCADWGVPFSLYRVQVDHNSGRGLEAAARDARYRALLDHPADIIALAHHQDDQLETALLGLIRGGGSRAIAAMPPWRREREKWLWRPMLDISRADIEHAVAELKLPYVDDPSNTDTAYLRNWVRREWLPSLFRRIPQARSHLQHAIAAAQEEAALIEEIAAHDWTRLDRQGTLNRGVWLALSPARRHLLLKTWAEKNHLGTPTRASVRDFAEHWQAGLPENAVWALPHGEAVVYGGQLWAWSQQHPLRQKCAAQTSDLWDDKAFIHKSKQFGLPWRCADFKQQGWQVRRVRRDDTLCLKVGHKSVLKILQEWKVPPFVRGFWPVLADEHDTCIAIGNGWVDCEKGESGGFIIEFFDLNQFCQGFPD